MPEPLSKRSFSFLSLYINLPGKSIALFLLSYLIFFFSGCTYFLRTQEPVISISQTDKENIISLIEAQGNIVSKFYCTGEIIVDGWILDSTANIFIAGAKDPFMFKIEVTHPWGKPVIHFLAKEGKLEVVDFRERKKFIGEFNSGNFSKFFPDMDIPPTIIWSFLRGYPIPLSHATIEEDRSGTIILKDRSEKIIENIKFSAENGNVESISLSTRSLSMKFNDFRTKGNIYYAEKTVFKGANVNSNRDMTIIRKNIVFNMNIPDEIFTVKKPQSFEVLYLEKM